MDQTTTFGPYVKSITMSYIPASTFFLTLLLIMANLTTEAAEIIRAITGSTVLNYELRRIIPPYGTSLHEIRT